MLLVQAFASIEGDFPQSGSGKLQSPGIFLGGGGQSSDWGNR
jgi:hypothetical protein